ncbi:hypothetical protein GCM10010988_23720 [Cnuibacter physcomitrellae]|uniref:Uncharacterized protein n=1 Tax=Cnuibacter physcomitrellae TaxID=1619308 RepID=A0A1X9LSX8_9MICO|nr:putative Ig domain-containing protein [Cnuibacter physcomitrellae]ARJ07021.1 hypothetical protein B5808_18665 [Cnuibacter physcomitrellae]GGI39368.1 hypothetical protein GCM10010988_23720 [Cnuibacter physcomitrellae]
MKPSRALSAVLAGALVAAVALVASVPAHAAAGDIRVYTDVLPGTGPGAVREAPDGSIWVAEHLGGYVHRYTAGGEHDSIYGPYAGFGTIADTIFGPDGRLWMISSTHVGAASGGALTGSWDLRGAAPLGGDVDPTAITSSDGSLWMATGSGFQGVVQVATGGAFDFIDLPERVLDIDAHPSASRVWFSEILTEYVGFVDPATKLYTRVPNPDGSRLNGFVAAAPDGSAWVASGADIYHVTVMGTSSTWQKFSVPGTMYVRALELGPDGTLWASYNGDSLFAVFSDGATVDFGSTGVELDELSVIGGKLWMSGGMDDLAAMELLVPPTLTACPTPTGTVGTGYSSGALPTTGSDPKRFSTVVGSVPPGLTLDTATGALSGTPTVAGTHVFTLRVTGSMGMREAAYDKRCVVTIAPAPAMPPVLGPLVESGGAVAGVAYFATVTTTGAEPMTLTVTSGSLPPGVTLATSGRVAALNGAPSTAGTYDFEITATNADGSNTRAYRIVVAPSPAGPPVLGGLVESGAAVTGAAYAASVTATGDEPMTFALTSGTLPPGITLTASGRVATLSGTPTTAGTYTFSLTVTNAAGAGTKSYRIVVAAAAVAPTLPVASWPAVQVNTPFSQTLTATGDEPLTFAVSKGTLPPGLALMSAGRTVTISGTPTAAGDTDIEITASNAAGRDSKAYRISVTAPPPAPVAPTLGEATWAAARVGDPFDASIAVTGTAPVDVRVTAGSLPAGLTLGRTATGVRISGTPISAGPAAFTLTATNAGGEVSLEYRITVEPLAVTPGNGGGGGTTPGASGGAAAGGGGAGGAVTGTRPGALASTGLTGPGGAPQLAVGALALVLSSAGAAAVGAATGRHRVFTVRSGAASRREG